MSNTAKIKTSRIKETGNREATVLEHDSFRIMIDDQGGMIPELSALSGMAGINAHWLPWFRSNSGKPYNEKTDREFWKAPLLFHLAGNFPCLPSFGGGHIIDEINMPTHGWTANLPWKFKDIMRTEKIAWASSTMKSPESAMPLSFKKIDAIVKGHNIHYSSITVKNHGKTDQEISAGWHNTLGAPFLAEGARISACADAWITSPKGSEFEKTTRLAIGAEFKKLSRAPLIKKGNADISIVPGPIGYTDFAAGRVPAKADIGWSSLVNPGLKMAYICFFTGPAAAGDDDIILRFNNLWMQYGGRPFTPWAAYEGGTDLAYCLGTENSIAAYAEGLKYARKVKKVLDAPATVTIPAGKEMTLRYGTLFAPYTQNLLDGGIDEIEPEKGALLCLAKKERFGFAADPCFSILKELEKAI